MFEHSNGRDFRLNVQKFVEPKVSGRPSYIIGDIEVLNAGIKTAIA